MTQNAIEKIYDQLMQVFGGTNPNQYFTLLMPGTTLDAKKYAYDTSKTKPELIAAAESDLVDHLFDVSKVTGSSNGQRLSQQYMQAISVLVPNFNPILPDLKNSLREFINQPAPSNALVAGKAFTGTLSEYYFALYENWLAIKSAWLTDVQTQKDALSEEDFLEWFEEHASGRLAVIDAAMGQLISVFSPADMEAIIGALQAGPGGELDVALQAVQDIRKPSPNGGYYYPVTLTPDNWFLDLASDENPTDLLNDPAFIAAGIAAKREAVSASISQIQALMAQQPTPAKLKADSDKLATANKAYKSAQANLLTTYASNTAVAVEMYLAAATDGAADDAEVLEDIDEDVEAVEEAKGEGEKKAEKKDGIPLTPEDVQKLLSGQKDLIKAQADLLSSAQDLATAGMNLASDEAHTFGGLPLMLARLKSQLSELELEQQNLSSAISHRPRRMTKLMAACQQLATKFSNSASAPGATAQKLHASFKTDAGTAETTFDQPKDAFDSVDKSIGTLVANKASVSQIEQTVIGLLGSILSEAKSIALASKRVAAAGNTAVAVPNAKAADVVTAVAAEIKKQVANYNFSTEVVELISTAAKTAAGLPNATPGTVAAAVSKVADQLAAKQPAQPVHAPALPSTSKMPKPNAKKSAASERYMSLQMYFDSTEMTVSQNTASSYTQTSWDVDLFFGSASGHSSKASSSFSHEAFDASTCIEIGLKAAKVDVSRGWFDPGIFKLSDGMNRLSADPVSKGTIDPSKFDHDAADFNKALLPSFPTALVIAKDVTIKFKANSSKLDQVKSVVDGRSASGGGLLCFSASSSSASHSSHSGLSSKAVGDVITIHMPGPQILGWFMECTPTDNSTQMTSATSTTDNEISIIQYVEQLKAILKEGRKSDAKTPLILAPGKAHKLNIGSSREIRFEAASGSAEFSVDSLMPNGKKLPLKGSPFTLQESQSKAVPETDLSGPDVEVEVTSGELIVSY